MKKENLLKILEIIIKKGNNYNDPYSILINSHNELIIVDCRNQRNQMLNGSTNDFINFQNQQNLSIIVIILIIIINGMKLMENLLINLVNLEKILKNLIIPVVYHLI